MENIIKTKIEQIEKNMISDAKDDNIAEVNIIYKIKSPGFNYNSPPNTSYTFSFDVKYNNGIQLNFEYLYNQDLIVFRYYILYIK